MSVQAGANKRRETIYLSAPSVRAAPACLSKRIIAVALVASLAGPVHADGLLSRLFGGRRQIVQQPACYYPQTYYAAPTYYAQPTVVVLADPYQYKVDVQAFRSFQEYQAQKQQPPTEAASVAPAAPRPVASGDAQPGAVVLKQNCLQCHQAGNSPKAGLALFAANGELNQGLPWDLIMERVGAEDPESRMPPKKSLAAHDLMAIMRLAQPAQTDVRTADNTTKASPFD